MDISKHQKMTAALLALSMANLSKPAGGGGSYRRQSCGTPDEERRKATAKRKARAKRKSGKKQRKRNRKG